MPRKKKHNWRLDQGSDTACRVQQRVFTTGYVGHKGNTTVYSCTVPNFQSDLTEPSTSSVVEVGTPSKYLKNKSESFCDDLPVQKEESDHIGLLGSMDMRSRLEYAPKSYQTVETTCSQKKKTRGRPSKYDLIWEKDNGVTKKHDASVVQCCLCFRNLLFESTKQNVFKRHKHFETDNVICSVCERVSNSNTLTTNTQPSKNTYEKLPHLCESHPGAIKPITKLVYVVRPPSDTDMNKIIVKKPRVYKKRNTYAEPRMNEEYGSASDSYTNTLKASNTVCMATSKINIWTQSNLDAYQSKRNCDSDEDDEDEDHKDNDDNCIEDLQNHSSAKLFVRIGKHKRSRKHKQLQSALVSRKNHDITEEDSQRHVNNLITDIKEEPIDQALDVLHSNSQLRKNGEIEVKTEIVDPGYEDVEYGACSNGQMYQTGVYVGSCSTVVCSCSTVEYPPHSLDQHANDGLAYVYLSNQDSPSISRSSLEIGQCKSSSNCVAVVPVSDPETTNSIMYIKQEADADY